jgi:hypothetical protein
MVGLVSRVHIFAKPAEKARMASCFSDVLGCGPPQALSVPGHEHPILAWEFPEGRSLSVEFTSDALDADGARHGAWLEFQAAEPETVKGKLREAGLSQIEYIGNEYFVIPGGQVIRVASA